MATMDGMGGPRKRLTTYGKAARKRVPEVVGIEHFNTQHSIREEEKRTMKQKNTELTSLHKSLPIPSSPPPSQSIIPGTVDMFEVPTSDDEGSNIPEKRRKISHQKRSPAGKQVSADLRQRGAQLLQSPNKSSHTNVHLPGKFEASYGVDDQEITKPNNSFSRIQNDHRLTVQVQKTSLGLSVAKNSLPDDTPPTRQKKASGKRSKHDQTPSPGLQNTLSRHPNAATRPTPRASKPSSQGSPATFLQPLSISSTPSVHEDPGRTTTRSDTPTVLTPRGQRMWNGLLGDEPVNSLETTSTSPDSTRGIPANLLRVMPRRRLIDSLINESEKSHSVLDYSSDSDTDEGDLPDLVTMKGHADTNYIMGALQLLPSASDNIGKIPLPNALGSGSQSSQTAGPKVTYSRQRSMLAEQEMTEKMVFDTPLSDGFPGERRHKRRGSIPILAPLRSLQESDEVDDGQASNSIRTIHELRQAGAQNRFLDEANDLLDRIGTPSQQTSMRRSGLMDLADKMLEKDFNTKFISNGLDQRLFLHLGQEEDVICGFVMISLLILVLNSGITPIAISQLRRQGITRMLIRLLDFSQPINTITKDRKTNMSKIAQKIISQQHEKLIKLGIWEDRSPGFISPRIATLRCLEMMVRQSREAGNTADLISKELTNKLFSILRFHLGNGSVLTETPALDFQLALSALESHSLRATSTLNEYLPVIREVLESVLQFPGDLPDLVQLLTLRLTLNITNNDKTTSDIFATPKVMRTLGCVVVSKFSLLSKFLVEDERVAVVDHVVLMLGVMMNFAEWSATARQDFVALHGSESDPFDDMVAIFADSFEKISEADSVEDSQRNVAFGYLAVVLGYLSLVPELERRIRARLKTLQPLISSIEEFIGHHEKVDEILKDEVDDYNPHTGLTDRLNRMLFGVKGLVNPR